MSSAVIFVMLMATALPGHLHLSAGSAGTGLFADHRLYSGHCSTGTAGRIYPEKIYETSVPIRWVFTCRCYHQLCVLGCTLLNIENHYGFVESLINALGSGLGFMLAMVLFAGVRSKMETVEFPKSFQGIPITLIAASIVSMSFMGFASVADGIFK